MTSTGPYEGTLAIDQFVPDADPTVHLLTLDVHQHGATLRGLWGPGHAATVPAWLAVTDLGSDHRMGSGGTATRRDGSQRWEVDLVPALPGDARLLRLTALATPRRPFPPRAAPSSAPPARPPRLGQAVVVELTPWPPEVRAVAATLDTRHRARPSPLESKLQRRPRLGPPGSLRVMAVSSRVDAGRSGDPVVTSIESGDRWFELHLSWDARQSFHGVMGTGWAAVDDLGGEYHGSPVSGSSGSGHCRLDFVFVPALDPRARALTVTLPDVVTIPATGAGALTTTLDLSTGE